jgi:hypothetical protein
MRYVKERVYRENKGYMRRKEAMGISDAIKEYKRREEQRR